MFIARQNDQTVLTAFKMRGIPHWRHLRHRCCRRLITFSMLNTELVIQSSDHLLKVGGSKPAFSRRARCCRIMHPADCFKLRCLLVEDLSVVDVSSATVRLLQSICCDLLTSHGRYAVYCPWSVVVTCCRLLPPTVTWQL